MGKFRKKIIILGCLVTILIGAIFIYYSTDKRERLTYDKNNTIAIYLEDSSSTDGYKLNNSKTFPTRGYTLNTSKSSCTNGGSLSQDENNKISLQISSSDSCVLYFDKIKINNAEDALKVLGLKTKEGRPNFAEAANTDETADGLYSMVDDTGNQSYYYRGAVENNYMKFGVDEDGNDMYWRIIRFNGDGSMRIQYEGSASGHSDTDFTYEIWPAETSVRWVINHINTHESKYIGYMFGGKKGEASTSKEQAQANESDSDIKKAVDGWYVRNVVNTGYEEYIADEVFCNDRSIPGKSTSGLSKDTGLGYGENVTAYGAYKRLYNYNSDGTPSPQFTCPQNNDKFTVSNKIGNGDLTYPVGLITADELVAAGSGKNGTKSSYYLANRNFIYWTMTPAYSSGDNASGYIFMDYYLNNKYLTSLESIAPVINIKPEYVNQLIGDGSNQNPYRLQTV